MTLVRRFRSKIAFTISAAFLIFPFEAALSASRIELKYLVTYLHVTVGSGQWRIEFDRGHYTTDVTGQITGMMMWLINGNGSGRAEGQIIHGTPQPEHFVAHVTSSAENDDITISFQNGAIRDVQALPPFPIVPKRVPITPELLVGTSDPLSAAFVLSNRESGAGPCGRQLQIFDGRRRYDAKLQFKRSEKVSIEPNFSGATFVCSVHLDPIAGQLTEGSVTKFLAETKDDIEIEYTYIDEAQAFVPVAATIPTLVGTLHVNAQLIASRALGMENAR
jgi:hypothetical protein